MARISLDVEAARRSSRMLARQIRRLRPGLVLLQHPYDLIFREPCSLHLSVLDRPDSKSPWRKISVAGQLEDENAKLKKLLAEQMLDAAALRDLLSKNGRARRQARRRRRICRP